ncbi:MAG: hypothetical protein NTZ04_04335 [Chloroflexi bacterium]|nr:hypothetical protein [Chloroflexota bacterium]
MVVVVQMNLCGGMSCRAGELCQPGCVSIIISLAIAAVALWVALRAMGRKDVG